MLYKVKFKLLLLILITILTITCTIYGIYAWLDNTEDKNGNISIGGINPQIEVLFDENGKIIPGLNYYDNEKKVILIDGGSTESFNSVTKLKVALNIETSNPVYIRVLIKDEWFIERTYLSTGNKTTRSLLHENPSLIPFYLENNWIYDYNSGYAYYKSIISENIIIPVLNGGSLYQVKNTTQYSEICTIYFDLELDIVQANRYSEVWGIESIPIK